VFCVMQAFLRNNAHTENSEGPKKKSQGSRNRRRSGRTKAPRKSRASAKARLASVTHETSTVPVTHGFGTLSPKSEPNLRAQQAISSPQMVPCHTLGASAGHLRTPTYAERMKEYIAQAIIEDSENDDSRSPPTLSHVYSGSPAAASSEPLYLGKCKTRLKNVSKPYSAVSSPSTRYTVPCLEACTPCKAEVEIYDDLPAAKRRLFLDPSGAICETNSDSRINSESFVGHVSHQNGYHNLKKLFTSSLNGRTPVPVDHYEDGLLAIANAACLMSTGVSNGSRNQSKVSEDQGQCLLAFCINCG